MALMRIQKELSKIEEHGVPDITAGPRDDDMFNWIATLTGPADTPYAGGSFIINIHFPADYPFKPPRVQFGTKVYHPNINTNGGICLDVIKDRWSPLLTIGTVLYAIRNLFYEPNVDDALEPEIATQYTEHRSHFERTAKEWTRRYATD